MPNLVTSQRPRSLRWCWLGRVPFPATADLQEQLRAEVSDGAPPILLLCEHDPVITFGRSAREEHVLVPPAVLAAAGVTVHSASRGGDVTYHGPGQIVGYPIMHVGRGVVAHVEGMAAAIIHVLGHFGLTGHFRRAQPGVWIDDAKICAFGVHVRRRVAIHGFSLNVDPDFRHFDFIVPCGLRGTTVTSLSRLLPAARLPNMKTIRDLIKLRFAEVAGRELVNVPAASIAPFAAPALD